MKELRELMRELREDHDLKQRKAADNPNISQQTYSADYLLRADTSCDGNNGNSNSTYLETITVHDDMYDMQELKPQDRRELARYLQYLKSVEDYEVSRRHSPK